MPEVAYDLNSRGITTKAGKEWTARAVGDLLANEIYVGVYAVADVRDEVPEYQVVSEETFDRVEEVRHRFQRARTAARERMPEYRKATHVDAVTDQYLEYLETGGESRRSSSRDSTGQEGAGGVDDA